jgi:hypothetical protein
MKVLFRQATTDDHAFIFATYLRNRWFDKSNKTTLKRSTWSELHHKRIEKILDTKQVVVACLQEDPTTILGYSFIDGNDPLVYVKLAWRASELNLKEKLLKELSNGL